MAAVPSVINTRGGYALIGGFDAGGKNSATSEVYVPGTEKYDPRPGNREFRCTRTSSSRPMPSTSSQVRDGPSLLKMPKAPRATSIRVSVQPFNGNKFKKVNDLTKPTQRGFGTSCWLGSIRRQKIASGAAGLRPQRRTSLIWIALDTEIQEGPLA